MKGIYIKGCDKSDVKGETNVLIKTFQDNLMKEVMFYEDHFERHKESAHLMWRE